MTTPSTMSNRWKSSRMPARGARIRAASASRPSWRSASASVSSAW